MLTIQYEPEEVQFQDLQVLEQTRYEGVICS